MNEVVNLILKNPGLLFMINSDSGTIHVLIEEKKGYSGDPKAPFMIEQIFDRQTNDVAMFIIIKDMVKKITAKINERKLAQTNGKL